MLCYTKSSGCWLDSDIVTTIDLNIIMWNYYIQRFMRKSEQILLIFLVNARM